MEQRASGQFLKVLGPAGVVVSMAGWMLDPVICDGMSFGGPRVDLAALVELERLLIGAIKPAHCRSDISIVPEESDAVSQSADSGAGSAADFVIRQHPAGRLGSAERDKIISALAQILMQAAGLSVEELKMTRSEMIPAIVLKRKAVVYVRQSTQSQVMTNLEGKRRQYDLVDVARQHGFVDVEIIDDDLGRSASGTVARPGFDRLVDGCAPGRLALFCASMHPGLRETVDFTIGITCLNYVGLSKPASLMARASITRVGQMIACSLA